MFRTLATACLLSSLAGPSLAGEVPIAQLRPAGAVTITGEVTAVLGNRFVLNDRSGQVLVDTGPRWYRRHAFTIGERLTVTGEPDEDAFEARRIHRADGATLVIRGERGPPPWARAGR
jgi:hypothetical protein